MSLPPDKQALKVATGQLTRGGGGQEAAVLFTRFTRHQVLSDFANLGAEHESRFLPIDAQYDIERVTRGTPGWPVVTRTMARLHGFELVPLPRARAGADDFGEHFREIVKQCADVTGALSWHLKDPPTLADACKIRAEVAEAIQALVELDAALAQQGDA